MLRRGAVLAGAPGGELSAISKALTIADGVYILADDTDTGTAGSVGALAYRTGHFARNKMTTGSSYALTAADEEIMRKGGILLSDAITY